MDPKLRALTAGEPLWNTPDDGAGGGTPGDDGAGNPPSDDKSDFDKGYGKGVKKGEQQGVQTLLQSLGVSSVDDLKAIKEAAAAAKQAADKKAEENGEYKPLYEELKAENETLKARAAKADAYEAAQKRQLEVITEQLSDEDKAALSGLPVEQALPIAQRFAKGGGKPPVGGPPAGNGGTPSGGGGKTLADYEKKGWKNLTHDERVHAEQLEAEQNKMTIGEMVARHQEMGGGG